VSLVSYGYFDSIEEDAYNSSLNYVVTSKMAKLFELIGDAVAGVERTFDRLEQDVARTDDVRLMRAMYYVTQRSRGGERSAGVDAKARATLGALAADPTRYHGRKALAALASMAYQDRDFPRAASLFDQYVAAHPQSPWSWAAALHAAHALEAQGKPDEALSRYEQVVSVFGTREPIAVVQASVSAARALKTIGRMDDALSNYRRALASWSRDVGDYVPLATRPAPARTSGPSPDRSRLGRAELTERVTALTELLARPGGAMLARARAQLLRGEFAAAREIIGDLLRTHRDPAVVADARRLLHRTTLEEAIDMASIAKPDRDDAGAAKLLDALLASDDVDSWTALAGLARSALLVRQGRAADARPIVQRAFEQLLAHQQPMRSQPPATPLEADLAAIRQLVFRPRGDMPEIARGWNAFRFPAVLPQFLVVRADVAVKTRGGMSRHTLHQPLPGLERTVFLASEELETMARMLPVIGGTARREPSQIMETPNQPIGTAADIARLWNEFFPMRAGHWGGWEFETYPVITQIEFPDDTRTKANAAITIGYSGATLVLEKVDGRWRVVRPTNQWIT
jgi:tetratricopeptide (TPR) repeat protein